MRWVGAFSILMMFSAECAGSDVRGTVDLIRSDGESSGPVANAKISLYSLQSMSETSSDSAGNFVFTGVGPGSYRLSAKAAGLKPIRLTHEIDIRQEQHSSMPVAIHFAEFENCADLSELSYGTIQPPNRTRLSIHIVRFADKRSIPGASVMIQQSDNASNRLRRTADSDGRIDISDVRPGSYILTVNKKGFHSESETVWLPTDNPAYLKVFLISAKDTVVCQ